MTLTCERVATSSIYLGMWRKPRAHASELSGFFHKPKLANGRNAADTVIYLGAIAAKGASSPSA